MWRNFKTNVGLPRALSRGFTIIELVVSISIVLIILAVALSGQSTYTERVALANQADEISLTISQAQAYGIGVREFSPGSSDFTISYGLAFSLLSSGSNTAYLYYADRNNNKIYDGDWACLAGGSSECLVRTDISRGNRISSLCVVRSGQSDLCNLGRIDISFDRPKTEAQLVFFNTGGNQVNLPGTIGAKIVLESQSGSTRSVFIYNTGQVSVQ